MEKPDSPSKQRRYDRVDLEIDVDLRFEDLGSFIQAHSENISLGGMFLKSEAAAPVGTLVRLKFSLANQTSLIEGTGRVVWNRPEDPEAGVPAGVGVRFDNIDEFGRGIIEKLVAMRIETRSRRPEPSEAPDSAVDSTKTQVIPSLSSLEAPPDTAGQGGAEKRRGAPDDSGSDFVWELIPSSND